MTLMCDSQIFPLIPVKKEVKATVSGIYITGCKRRKRSSGDPGEEKGIFRPSSEPLGSKENDTPERQSSQGFFFCSSNIGQSDMVYLRRYSLGRPSRRYP